MVKLAVGLAVDLSDLVHTSSTGTGSKIAAFSLTGGLVGNWNRRSSGSITY